MKFLLLALMTSCTLIRVPFSKAKNVHYAPEFRTYEINDYTNHWAAFRDVLTKGEESKLIKLNREAETYLSKLTQEILEKNETFFLDSKKSQVYVMSSPMPFHFSLPGHVIFMSSGLINKYIKHEGILASILSYELIRSQKGLYTKTVIIPTGYLSIERMLSLNRLTPDFKLEIHKWAYHFTKRTGFDGEYYLSWLQIQNRNSSDFNLMLGDNTSISMEEAYFKNFLVKKAKTTTGIDINKKNSSKEFYKFLFYIKDKTV